LIKYDNAGSEVWTKRRNASDKTQEAKAYFLEIDANGHIIVTGEEVVDGSSYLKTIRYDSDAHILWEGIHDGLPSATERPTGMLINANGDIVITALTQAPGDQSYETVNYTTKVYTPVNDYNEEDIATNVDKEIVIRFSPKVIDSTFADNTALTHGQVKEIITDQSLINQMDYKLQGNGDLANWIMKKVCPFLTTNDVFTTDRYGEIAALPPFWATYILLMENELDEEAASDALETLPARQIWWAEPNYIFEYHSPPLVVDPLFTSDQGSLNADLDPDGHINIEPVWDRGISGSSDIRVAVFDTGLSFGQPDFQGDASYGGLAGSVVGAGVYIDGNVVVMDDNDTDNGFGILNAHGSLVSGIIGALRNNGIGISGIAGGDILGLDGDAHRGVELQIYNCGEGIKSADVLSAVSYMTGLPPGPDNPPFALPLPDITSHSYGTDVTSPPSAQNNYTGLRESFYTMYGIGLVNVVSRGNDGGNDIIFPGTFDPGWMITVGASGNNGMYKDASNGLVGNVEDQIAVSFG
jgi:Subtilase family